MPRPIWEGHVQLLLVSCPVALFSAATASEPVKDTIAPFIAE